MANAPFFDFHLHPAFKKFICQFEPTYPTKRPVADLVNRFELTSHIVKVLDEELLHILGSQACVDELDEGHLALGVAAIAPIEKLFTNKKDGGLFGKILNSGLTKPLDLAYMDRVRDGQISYYQLFIREINIYKRLQDAQRLHMLNRQAPALGPDAKPQLALSLEGGHGLCRTMVGNPSRPDTSLTVTTADSLSTDFLSGFTPDPARSLQQLQQALWNQKLDLCYLVLTHLSHIDEQRLATHAYGMKMINDVSSYPIGNGIYPKGFQVIDAAYTLKVKVNGADKPAPVLIDIKHMSLKSRLDLYAYRREKGYTLPLIASHVGVTGYSVGDWKAALDESTPMRLPSGEPIVKIKVTRKRAGFWGSFVNREFTYNAWSINVMDEDIEAVLNSNGLIGVSLDARILGWHDTVTDDEQDEYQSAEEFRFFFPERFRQMAFPAPESKAFPTRQERHPLALCFNILHIVSVGLIRTDKDPWAHICIGSDYDGLINPVINCRDTSQLPVLEENLIRWLPVAEAAYRDENGGPPLLTRNSQGEVDPVELKKIVRAVLYANGEQFIKRWLTNFS
jgi:hypothetical protein